MEYGSTQGAWRAAIEYLDWLKQIVPPRTAAQKQQEPTGHKKPNTSGVVGVYLNQIPDKYGTRHMYWVAEWDPVPGGRPKRRKFSVARYGDAEAKALAVEAREDAMKLLEEQRLRHWNGMAPDALSGQAQRMVVEVHLEEQQARRLAELARQRGMSCSTLIAEFVDVGLADETLLRHPPHAGVRSR